MDRQVCYGVDLDGTLAHHDEWKGGNFIGKPIPKMMEKVKKWLSEGIKVVIFTARADDPDNLEAIIDWLDDNGLPELEVTNIKTPEIKRFYDDRAIQVVKNEGTIIGDESLINDSHVEVSAQQKLDDMYNQGIKI